MLIRTINSQVQQCQCYHITDQFICEISKRCQWLNNKCNQKLNYIIRNGNKCEQYQEEECVLQTDCAFIDSQCIDFQGCDKISKDKCASSINCISDGNICISKKDCQNYKTQLACQNQDINGGYCSWNLKQFPICSKILECSDLPILRSHLLCQTALNHCTINQKGMCIDKAIQCEQYKIFQCFSTIDGKECFWNQSKALCMEKICVNAQFSTDKLCNQFLSTCTTNGFNCILRTKCNDFKHINGCVIDIDYNQCFWTGSMCIKKVCSNIPKGEECSTYFQDLDCVPTQQGNCKSKPQNCNQFETQDSCLIDYAQQQCWWENNECVLKTCQIAPQYTNCALWKNDTSCVGDTNGYCIDLPQYCSSITNNTYCYKQNSGDLCHSYTCTIAYCSKAPVNLNSHIQCEQWNINCTVELKDSNSQVGQGCVYKLQNCQDYENEIQCKSTLDRIQCIFKDGKCLEKTCEMGKFSTQEDCQNWKNDCIINEFSNSCKDWPSNCYELLSEEQCYIGLQSGIYCQWKDNQCQIQSNSQLCSTANNISQYDNHEKCNRWNGLCTVIQKVYGCEARQNCEDYLYQHQCVIGIDNQKCQWDGIQCIRKCDGYQIETVDINECESIDSSCQLNDLTAICIYKTYCQAYKNKLDCKINNNDQPCKWNQLDQKCEDVICEDNTTAITESECIYFLNYQQCYLDTIGCITRPLKCDLISNNIICNHTIPRCMNNYCYYHNGCCTQILANQCELIDDATTDYDCQKHNPECILNILTGIGCMHSNNCEYIQDQTLCTSIDAPVNLNSHIQCEQWNINCTVELKDSNSQVGQGCVYKLQNCQDYENEIQCKSTLDRIQCIFKDGKCLEKTCEMGKFSTQEDCQNWKNDCIINEFSNSCKDWPSNCYELLSEEQCYIGLQSGIYCQWKDNQCQIQSNSQLCSTANNISQYDNHEKCNRWNGLCTVIQKVYGCEARQNCEDYLYQHQCVIGIDNQKCQWDGIQCIRKCDGYQIETVDINECESIDSSCQLNDLTAICIYKTYCQAYKNKLDCKINNNDQPCKWNQLDQKCEDVICEDNTTAITESECIYFLNYQQCYLDTIGCITRPLKCDLISNNIICNHTIPRCMNNYCYYHNGCCTQILANQCELIDDATTDYDCQKHNPECILNILTGIGCMHSNNCEYIQDQTLCTSIDGTLKLPSGHTCVSQNNKCYSQQNCNAFNTNCNTLVVQQVNCKFGTAGTCVKKLCTDLVSANATNCPAFQKFCYYYGSKCIFVTNGNDLTSYGSTFCNSRITIDGQSCQWNGTSCQLLSCSLLNNNCLLSNNKCIQGMSNCIDITNCNQVTNEVYCYLAYNSSNLKCLWINSQCVDYFDCTNTFTNGFTEYQCIRYDLCRLSKTTTGCEFKSCNEYQQMEYCNKLNQCIWYNNQCENQNQCQFQLNQTDCEYFNYCYWNTALCKQNVCNTATTQQSCFSVILQSGNKCLWINNVCQEQYQCSQIKNPLFFDDCYLKNNGCVIKYNFSDKSSYCQTKKAECSLYTSNYQCTKDIYNNLCEWDLNTSTCIYNQCSAYVTSNNIYSNWICLQFNNKCVLNTTLNGCRTILSLCNLYTTQQLCQYAFTTSKKYCFWNGSSCIDAQCSQYNSLVSPPLLCEQYSQCNLIGSICQNKLSTCNSYLDETLCNSTTDLSSNICVWINDNCVIKSCSNYPFNNFNHSNCSQWLKSCTVNQQETQCINIIDCTTAPQEIDTINECEQFQSQTIQICTISSIQSGCTNLVSNCNLASKIQCFIDVNRNKCYWSKQYGVCKELNCINIDNTIKTASDCESLLNECTLADSGFGCQNKASCNSYNNNTCKFLNIRDNNQRNCVQGCQKIVCEDYYSTSDQYCKSILNGNCITNGVQCITSYSCSDFRFDYQCIISRQGFQCLWFHHQCVNRKCELADIANYHSHSQCQSFMNTCTYSKQRNSCVQINNCQNNDNIESCFLDKYGQQCIWYEDKCYNTKCENICGDGIVNLETEQCDDGNWLAHDGCYDCKFSCVIGCYNCLGGICVECDYENGYYLDEINNCITKCGDEIVQGKEHCDDGNLDRYDGCFECLFECHHSCILCFQGTCLECQHGWSISIKGQCEVICGDGIIVTTNDKNNEQCDDANIDSLDGCSSTCMIEQQWTCYNDLDSPSVCQYTQQPYMILTLLNAAPNYIQSIKLSFTSNLKYQNTSNNYSLIQTSILNLNPINYQIQIHQNNSLYSITTYEPIEYLIIVEFLISVQNPTLLISFQGSEFLDQNNQHPLNTKQTIKLFTCYYETESNKRISSTTNVFNSILLYILLAIALLSILTCNLDVFWNLLDMVQYLSYIKYINIQFPTNLNTFFNLFTIITLQPLLDFIHYQDIINLFCFGETIFIQTTNKFLEDNINAFYFYNFGSSLLVLGTTFASLYVSLALIYTINKYIHHVYNHLNIIKIVQQLLRLLVKFQFYFFYSGIIRIFLTNTYDILFSVLLQLYYPQFHNFITIFSLMVAAITFSFIFIVIYFIMSKQTSKSIGICNQYTVLSEGVTFNQGFWARQFNSLLLIKKLIFMLLLIFMQEDGQLQTTLISITHISFALYLISKKPMTNSYEYYKMIFVESKITLATSFFILYSMPNLTLDTKYRVGWFHITIFTSMLAISVFFDFTNQLRIIKQKLIKSCADKQTPNSKVILFEAVPTNKIIF
ncbi:unnamed protein product [Paramecium sonneborni]|uniref:PSI domain-containing protein n=1 Tax=Paramecium sonneborni TaxID=65129 RepID=A0A8S1KUA5_9CILI|nr:unnamed protein product [Paramecium sonneborni]